MKWLNQNEGSVFSGKKILFWYNFRQAMMITELNLCLFKFLISLRPPISPGAKFPTLCEKCVDSLMSPINQHREDAGDGAKGL